MKVVALVSGGKDSCYAMMKCLQYGHEIVALANLLPADDAVDELDSYMYQTVGHQIVVSYARCMGLPLFRRRLQGSSRHLDLGYRTTPGDEVEDLFILLCEIKRQIPSISAVSSGAIASDYQRLRVENVCSRLGLVSLAYLWKQDQRVLLEEMIKDGILAILVKVAAIGLDPSKHLGKELAYMSPHLHHLNKLYGSNICGEGGEYETLTLDCPLFKFARIVLDEFQVVLHSPDSIAPVGVLHPSAFHLKEKEFPDSTNKSMILNGASSDVLNHVFEVLGDSQQLHIDNNKPLEVVSDTIGTSTSNVQISKKGTSSTLSISCWMQNPPISSGDLQGDLKSILLKVESQLKECSFGWEDALYIHLYIADMNQFPVANETYVSFITQDRCPFGVPSRSTIELPLLQVGLGRAYIEVLVAKQQTKRVLHVQSISCWAPSCIGPYSQATLYKGILHMAGQLGLDPPTMTLSAKDPTIELEQVLLNSEAIAESFHCSISTSAICFVIYCSVQVKLHERVKIQKEMKTFLSELRASHSNKRNVPKIDDPLILFVLVPALPKSALVEVKPLLYIKEEIESDDENVEAEDHIVHQNYWGFGPKSWHDLCLQKCNVLGKLFAAILCVTDDLAAKISEDCVGTVQKAEGCQDAISEKLMEQVVKYCIYLLDQMLMENLFSWNDSMFLRIYFKSTSISSMEKLSTLFSSSFLEFAEMNPTFDFGHEPIFTLVPVLGSGISGDSADAVITCEILAQKP